MKKIAHISECGEQTIQEHLQNVAGMTSEFCDSYHIRNMDVRKYAYETGLAHDIGKYSDLFQKKLRENLDIQVDHSTAGAREMKKNHMLSASFAVAGHHGGIPNGLDTSGANLLVRVNKREIESYKDFDKEIKLEPVKESHLSSYETSFFTRMLFSALVDADFLDTERAMNSNTMDRGNYASIDDLYFKLMDYIKPWRNIEKDTSDLNKIRTKILEQCIQCGNDNRGLFSLTVPTGGGKTVSSLAFALAHAKRNHMKRIIYVIPYTSIIEQTVEIFREILGEQNVLAHYGNSLLDDAADGKSVFYEKHKLSIENWDAPVIVTTSVQFFESLYSNKVSKCRKLHNISNSVVIFDEAQMIPLGCIKPCVKAIQTLIESYQVSAVFCTATQPALERWMEPLNAKEICSDYKEVFYRLKRTKIINKGKITEDELVQKIILENQILVIVNTKQEAQKLYQLISEDDGSFHLSTNMTPADRRKALNRIRDRMNRGETCRVISTSLVEAGVDLDFPTVYREIAGLDSIIQAAGRCNREGKRGIEESVVWVFQLEDQVPKMIEKNVTMTEETLQKYGEYDSLDAIRYYFTGLQSLDEASLDCYQILDRLEHSIDGIEMPFKKTAEIFHMIDSDTKMLIIPLETEASQLVDELQNKVRNGENFKAVLQKVGFYAINVYENRYQMMISDGSVYELLDGVGVLQRLPLYTKDMGLCYEACDGATMI